VIRQSETLQQLRQRLRLLWPQGEHHTCVCTVVTDVCQDWWLQCRTCWHAPSHGSACMLASVLMACP
jgi:hypothetical protein